MSLLDGMEDLGLGHLNKVNVYTDNNDNKKVQRVPVKKAVKEEETEDTFLFFKEFECPVCGVTFKASVVKTGKARLIKQDKDLRPIYKGIDAIKYDVIHCNKCGYAALTKYYGTLAKPHKEMIKANISANYKPMETTGLVLDYEQAFLKYKLALANAICRQAKDSEKAYICLKSAWLLRGMQEQTEDNNLSEEDIAKLSEMENEYLKDALEGFISARQNETPPIAGMNDITLDFLLAALSMRFEDYSDAVKLLQGILLSTTSGNAQKDKARELLLEIKEKIKK